MSDIFAAKFNDIVRKYGVTNSADQTMLMHEILYLVGKQDVARKEMMTVGLVDLLLKILAKVRENNKNDITRNQLSLSNIEYSSLAKLRYWGLIHHPVDGNGRPIIGRWLLTRRAGEFFRNEVGINEWLKVQRNAVVQRSDRLIYIEDYKRQLPEQRWQTCEEHRAQYRQEIANYKQQLPI